MVPHPLRSTRPASLCPYTPRLRYDDPLHPDARLTRLIEGAEDDPRERVVQVGVLVDDHRGIAAEFEHDLLLARFGLQIPTDARRAGEGEQFQPLVGGERSEEQTSELQSLQRLAYALICLKKK